MQITSGYYILILILTPLVLNFKPKKYIFLGLSLAVFCAACGSPLVFAVSLAYVLLPYLYVHLFKVKWPLFLILVISFLYLKRYDWIFKTIHIPYVIPFAIFGISYIVFRIIDYVINYDFLEKEEKGIVDYLNYVLNLYTIICGPIMTFANFRADFYSQKESLSRTEILECLNRAADGYVQVLLLSNLCQKAASYGFDKLSSGSGFLYFLLFMIANVWYIYFNFNGYCDVVIALAKIAGFVLPENFNKPYLANDISDFWNRQHSTLTKWITSYIFTPVVKNMTEKMSLDVAQYIGFFVAFLVAGLWHGTTLNYLVYGILQAIGVCLTKLYTSVATKKLGGKKAFREFRKKKSVRTIEIFITQAYIYFSFIFIGYDVIGLIIGG